MSILDVIHRVFVGLGLCDVEVEVEVLVVGPRNIEKTCRVISDFSPQLPQGVKLAAAGRHLDLLAAAVQRDELYELNLEVFGPVTHGFETGLHPRYVSVMVSPEDVD